MPIGIAISKLESENDTNTEGFISPECMINYPINEYFEVGVNTRLVIPFEKDFDNSFGINLAFGISKDLSKWVIRPEIGIVASTNPDDEGILFTSGLAFIPFSV